MQRVSKLCAKYCGILKIFNTAWRIISGSYLSVFNIKVIHQHSRFVFARMITVLVTEEKLVNWHFCAHNYFHLIGIDENKFRNVPKQCVLCIKHGYEKYFAPYYRTMYQ